MSPSVADIDWAKLEPRERDTLEKIIPLIQEGYSPAEIAEQLGRDTPDVQAAIDDLGTHAMALSGRNELPAHTPEEFEALKSAIEDHEQRFPILRGSASSGMPGKIIDGNARLRICRQLKREPWIVDVDGSADQLRSLGLVLNVARRHLNSSSRRGLVKVELLRDPTRSDRAIAAAVGVAHKTVASVRRDLERGGEIPHHHERVGADGVAQPAGKPASDRPEPTERPIRVLVPTDRFEAYVGPWVRCSAFRLIERRPGVHELQVQLVDVAPVTAKHLDELEAAASRLAAALDRAPENVLMELLVNASDVFGRPIPHTGALYVDEAAWAVQRMNELAEMAA